MILVLSLTHWFLVSKKSSFGLIISIWNYHNIYFSQPAENTVGNNPKQLTKPQATLQHVSLLESYLSEIAFAHLARRFYPRLVWLDTQPEITSGKQIYLIWATLYRDSKHGILGFWPLKQTSVGVIGRRFQSDCITTLNIMAWQYLHTPPKGFFLWVRICNLF